VFLDDDADLKLIQDRHVAVLGYGSDGPAHALSLRDCGVDVRLGLAEGSPDHPVAESEGLRVVPPYEACEEADLVAMIAPQAEQGELFTEAVEPNLLDGDAVVFISAFAVRYGVISPPDGVDVALVQPVAPGEVVRREYSEGRGAPALLAVDQDATGQAWPLTLSYAKAIGGLRAGGIEATFAQAAEAALFGQQAVLAGGVVPLVLAGFETLTEAGCSPELAYLECVHRLAYAVDRLHRDGIGPVETSGVVVAPDVRERMRSVLEELRKGTWAEQTPPTPDADAALRGIEAAGRELRSRMPWLYADR